MKRNILLALALLSFGANAQQKLIGFTNKYYDQSSALVYMDSSEYTYASWEGSLTSNEPKFAFSSPVFDWYYEIPAVAANVQNLYSGIPLVLDYSRQNTIVNGKITESEVFQNDRLVYTYDGSGNLTKTEYFFWNVSQFDISGEEIREYDANNNLTLIKYVSDPVISPTVENVDSMFYDASNHLIRSISYYNNGTLQPESESLLTFSGNEVSNVKLYETNGTSLEWTFDIDYTYAGGMPTLIEGYSVTGGVPSTTPDVEIAYTYNTNNQLSLYEAFLGGDLFNETVYTYDANNFIQRIETSELDFATSSLYLANVQDFYYQSTASLNEELSATISVYPNPSSDFITVESDNQVDRVAIYSSNGNMMTEQNGNTIDVSNLSAGVYLVKAMTSEGLVQSRFVKN